MPVRPFSPHPPAPDEAQRQGFAAYLTGHDAESIELLSRAHAGFADRGDWPRAALSAFWIAFVLSNRGERARASGWLARASRLAEEAGVPCAAAGFVRIPLALQHIGSGDFDAALACFDEAIALGRQLRDPDLSNLALPGRGRTLMALGRVADGIALLDEAMIAVTAGEVSPIVTGTIYCSVISGCFDIFDFRRAQEWTAALDEWCAAHPHITPYRGECLVHRAEIMVMHGSWDGALAEAERACEWLAQPWSRAARGAAQYVIAEVHRRRGSVAAAERAYDCAADAGRTPHPGLALLRLAQGQKDAARQAVTELMADARDPRTRLRCLPAQVEILLSTSETGAALGAAEELEQLAATLDQPWLHAAAAHALGAVALAQGDAGAALPRLRKALSLWQELDAPYEGARTGVLMGLCCRRAGQTEAARAQIAAAARAFRALGAAELEQSERLLDASGPGDHGVLTAREKEILKLVARGLTNRTIAATLAISEKTVARHLSNIFTKLDLPSRAAATAYAIRHDLA